LSKPGKIKVEVVYAEPARQWVLSVEVTEGATVREVLAVSGIEKRLDGLAVDPKRVGVFGRRVTLDQIVVAGDRVELYRPLQVDPKEVRRARAKQQQSD
jgi:putative ubiquitin-RnfH superfamily antitoxin RatB of RatAB toxin-antitoxin module